MNDRNPMIVNLLNRFLAVDFDKPGWVTGDWMLAIVSLGVGLWFGWHLWTAVGVVGLFLAWWRPMTRLQRLSRGIISKAARSAAN